MKSSDLYHIMKIVTTILFTWWMMGHTYSQGAPCAITLGPELLRNGTFTDQLTCCDEIPQDSDECLISWRVISGTPDYRSPSCDPANNQEIEDIYGIINNGPAIQLGKSANVGESLGQCLDRSLSPTSSYFIQWTIGTVDFLSTDQPEGVLVVYGWPSCAAMISRRSPASDCNDGANRSLILGSIDLSDLQQGTWHDITLSFTPRNPIRAISIETPCSTDVGGSFVGVVIDDISLREVTTQGQPTVTRRDTIICREDSVFFGDRWVFPPGRYRDTIPTSTCDSIIELEVIEFNTLTTVQMITICSDTFHVEDGDTLRTPGIYEFDYISNDGCDSIFAIDLRVHEAYISSPISLNFCEGQDTSINGQLMDTSRIYDVTYPTVDLCDSIIRYNVIIEPILMGDILVIDTVGQYIYRGDTLRMPGIYPDTVQTVDGCDSLIILQLTFSDQCNPITINTDISHPDCDNPQGLLALSSDAEMITTYSIDGGSSLPYNSGITLDAGTYNITAGYGDSCTMDTSIVINNYTPQSASWDAKTTLDRTDTTITVAISNINIPPVSYDWNIDGDITTCNDCPEQDVMVSGLDDISIQVILTDSLDCMTSLFKEICIGPIDTIPMPVDTVIEGNIYFPTVFSPNDDGLNDAFYFSQSMGADYTIKNLRIFDRFGTQVYALDETRVADWNGWDGDLHGEPALSGTYAYHLLYEASPRQIWRRKGTVLLVR